MHTSTDTNNPRSFVVTVQFGIYPEHVAEFMREMVVNARTSRASEPGCLVFDVCEDPAQAGQVFLYEVYRDAAAFEQHKREVHYLEFDRTVAPWVQHKSVKSYSLVGQ